MMGYTPQPQTGIEIRITRREHLGNSAVSDKEVIISGINDRTTAEELSLIVKEFSGVMGHTCCGGCNHDPR